MIFFKENWLLRKKFNEHTNSIFDKYKLKNGIYEQMDEVVALTNTTKSGPGKLVWEIGNSNNDKSGQIMQFLSKNYPANVSNGALEQIKEHKNKNLSIKIQEVMCKYKERVNVVEEDLADMYNNTNNLLETCLNKKLKTMECIEMYNLSYGSCREFTVNQIWLFIP